MAKWRRNIVESVSRTEIICDRYSAICVNRLVSTVKPERSVKSLGFQGNIHFLYKCSEENSMLGQDCTL